MTSDKLISIETWSSVFDPCQIAEVITKLYGYSLPASCTLLTHGRNDTYLLRTSNADFYLKVYGARTQSPETISAEIQLLLHLNQSGVAASKPIPTKFGNHYFPLLAPEGPRLAALYAEAPGRSLASCLNEINCEAAGELLSRTHTQMSLFRPTIGTLPYKDFTNAFTTLREFGVSDKTLYRLRSTETTTRLLVEYIFLRAGRPSLCHGDFHDENIKVTTSGAATIIDFEDWHISWREYDLATFLRTLLLRYRTKTGDLSLPGFEQSPMYSLWNAFLRGYRRHSTITPEQLRIVHAFVPLRRLAELAHSASLTQILGRHTLREGHISMALDFIDSWVRRYHP